MYMRALPNMIVGVCLRYVLIDNQCVRLTCRRHVPTIPGGLLQHLHRRIDADATSRLQHTKVGFEQVSLFDGTLQFLSFSGGGLHVSISWLSRFELLVHLTTFVLPHLAEFVQTVLTPLQASAPSFSQVLSAPTSDVSAERTTDCWDSLRPFSKRVSRKAEILSLRFIS